MVYFTTEANAYGAGTGRWYDGEVHPYKLKRGMQNNIAISRVTAYEYLKPACSQESFYQTVAAKLKTSLACKEFIKVPCSPITLPDSGEFKDQPLCRNAEERLCYKMELVRIMKRETHSSARARKTCRTQEYEVRELETPKQLVDGTNGFEFKFDFASASTSGERNTHVKTVKTEEWALTLFTLVGSVGGWFGLMVGFSFYGLADEVIGVLHQLWRKYDKFDL